MGSDSRPDRDAEATEQATDDIGNRSAPDPDGTVEVRRPDPAADPAGPSGTLRSPAPPPHPEAPHRPSGPPLGSGPGTSPGYDPQQGRTAAPPSYGAPSYGAPSYGAPSHGAPPSYGAQLYGPPPYGPPPGAPGQVPGGMPARDRRRTRTVVVVVGIVVALLVAGGAVVAVTGLADRLLPSAAPPVPAPAATPASLVGDERTADPCSLLTESSVRRFGRPETVPDRGWPTGCGIELSSNGPGFLSLTAFLTRPDPAYPPRGTPGTAGRGLTVYREPAATGSCRRTVETDGTRVVVSAVAREGGRGDLCAVAEAGTSTTVAALSAGPLPRRSGAEAPSPLEAVDMCAAADAGVVGRATGVDTSRRKAGFGDWSCYWGYDRAFRYASTVDVSFARYARLTGTPTRIAGRTAQVSPSTTAGDTSCSVDLVQRTYTTPGGASRVEVVTVTADAGRQSTTDASCRNARTVADALVPRLPAA